MAAIDKIYVDSFEKYKLFKDWCMTQPKIKDKYGKETISEGAFIPGCVSRKKHVVPIIMAIFEN